MATGTLMLVLLVLVVHLVVVLRLVWRDRTRPPFIEPSQVVPAAVAAAVAAVVAFGLAHHRWPLHALADDYPVAAVIGWSAWIVIMWMDRRWPHRAIPQRTASLLLGLGLGLVIGATMPTP